MKLEIKLNKGALKTCGYTMEQVTNTVMNLFYKEGLDCKSEGAVLTFSDQGRKQDYSLMWLNITKLIKSSWFVSCADSCKWYDEENGEPEDILSQAWKLNPSIRQ